MVIGAFHQRGDGLREIGIVTDQNRRRAAMLERASRARGASLERRYQPTRDEPIKLKNATLGSVTKRSAVGISHTQTWHNSSGNPASRNEADEFQAR